ncbi:hypothetical protein [Paenibacillus glycanilyticus]|uniref:DUF4829 domain-containing protein n=1 Tax=Paenibacillus glycanilyticus TaxID=126569 RepID=A0ABQ6GC66_9BACL|nr:hypothetical protein [Paenibacillus glycanilyticus]GLX66667.1 hypothetical protein MU1_10110 [Paenibacillus glycanilyticus]
MGRKTSIFITILAAAIAIASSYYYIMLYTPNHTVSKVLDASIQGESIQELDATNNAVLESFWSSVNETTRFKYSIKRVEAGWKKREFLVYIEKINYNQENNVTGIIHGSLYFKLSRSFINNWTITDIRVTEQLT